MKNFNNIFNHEKRNSASEADFKRKGPSKREFGRRDGGRPQMYEAVCSQCGKRCELPFRPTGDKPVYCSQCFNDRGGAERSEFRRGGERPRFRDKKMFDAVCDKCGKRFELPFKPTGERAVYCKDCFEKKGGPAEKNDFKEQFGALNAKLDILIKLLTPASPEKDSPKAAKKEKVKEEKVKKVKKAVSSVKKTKKSTKAKA